MRPFPCNRAPFRLGRVGAKGVLRLPQPVPLGTAFALGLHLHGLPLGYALTGAKADERQVFRDILAGTEATNQPQVDGNRQILIGDKNYYGADSKTPWTKQEPTSALGPQS